MMMAMVGMMGVAAVAGVNMLSGPITTASKVTNQNMAQNDLLMNAKVVVMNAATRPNGGDEDGDGYIEPAPFIPTSEESCNITLPGEGGCLPMDIGAIQTDPWGTQYAYCVWDHGTETGSENRIAGEDSTSGAVIAIISAGPNKQFETPCLPYDGDPETNDIGINPDGLGDDLVQIYTYAGAVSGSGGLWELKQGEPTTAVIDKRLEVGDMSGGMGFAFDTVTGEGEFPYVKTDYLASRTGGATPVTMDSNIALDGNWLSGDGDNRGIFVDSNGNVGIGTNTPMSGPFTQHTGGLLQVSGETASLTLTRYHQAGASPDFFFQKSRGSMDSPSAVQARDTLGYISWGGHNGTDFSVRPAAIYARVEDVDSSEITATTIPASLHFATTPSGGTPGFGYISNTRMTIASNGNVGIGTSVPTNALHITGGHNKTTAAENSIRVSRHIDTSVGPILYFDKSRQGGQSLDRDWLGAIIANGTDENGESSGDLAMLRFRAVGNTTSEYSGASINFSMKSADTGAWSHLIIDDSGHLGIGTTEPEAGLHSVGEAIFQNDPNGHNILVRRFRSSPGLPPRLIFQRAQGTQEAPSNSMFGDGLGELNFMPYWDGGFGITAAASSASITSTVDEPVTTSVPGALTFRTRAAGLANSSERMRITSGGNVGIGTTSPSAKLDILYDGSDAGIRLRNTTSDPTTGRSYLAFYAGSTRLGYVGDGFGSAADIGIVADIGNVRAIGVGGSCYVNTGGCTSDIRLKQDIQPVEGALAKLMKLSGVSFEWKKHPGEHYMGFIAQEVEKQFPILVKIDEEGTKSVNYNGIVAPIVEAIKELKARLDDLVEQVAELSRHLTALAMSDKSQNERIAELEAQNDRLRNDLEAANDNFRRELDELRSAIGE